VPSAGALSPQTIFYLVRLRSWRVRACAVNGCALGLLGWREKRKAETT